MEAAKIDQTRSKLGAWLAAHWPDCSDIEVKEIRQPSGGGNSAETSLMEVSYNRNGAPHARSLVLRRQLEGSDLFLDPRLDLPYNMMKAMAEHSSVPVPPVIGIEFDRSILGSPFLVMEAVKGRIVPQSPNYNATGWVADLDPAGRDKVWRNAIEVMASINRLDWKKGFAFLDKPEHGAPGLDQYINALEAWYRWAANGRRVPILEAGMAYLRDKQPKAMPVSVMWGDSHSANILFRDDLSVAAVIDWEAAALGAAEADFGYWLFFDELYSKGFGVERLSGLPDRDAMISCYEAALGRPVRDLTYFEILGAMRFAIILVRFADRMVGANRIPATSKAGEQNPATHIMAEKMGVASPGGVEDFISMSVAAGAM